MGVAVAAVLLSTILLPTTLLRAEAALEAVLFQSDFESTKWYEAWGLKRASANTSLVTGTIGDGFQQLTGNALRVTIPKGQHKGVGELAFFPRSLLNRDPTELYFRYDLRFGSAWHPSSDGKLPGFGGTYGVGGWGGIPSTGYNGWSARGEFKPLADGRISLGSYVYHADMDGIYGSSWNWTAGHVQPLERDRWYGIEKYIKLNEPGKSNGILRAWIDGEQVFERTGLRFREVDSLGIEKVWMNVYHGGSQTAKRDLHLYIDNVIVSKRYIGPSHPALATRLPAPRDLTVTVKPTSGTASSALHGQSALDQLP